jgi:nucleoside-diphosphate-sugar epimerase
MRLLITGAGGYIGSVLVQRSLAAGHAVKYLDVSGRQPPGVALQSSRRSGSVEMVVGDVRDYSLLQRITENVDAIIHLAGVVGYPACDAEPECAVSVNVGGTRCITDLSRRDIPLVNVSTCSVYGGAVAEPLRETDQPQPLTLYGRTKLEAEQLVASVAGINLRLTTVYGPSPRMRSDLLIHNFCNIALSGAKLTLFDPSALRPFLHVEDAVTSMIFAVENWRMMSGNTYNVGSGPSTVSKLELVRLIDQLVPLDFVLDETQSDPEKRQSRVSFDRIESCGFSARWSLARGLAGTIDVLRRQMTEGDPV